MKVTSKKEVSRERLIAIIFYEKSDAPFIGMGHGWRIAASAIDKNNDFDDGYFVGFNEIAKIEMKEIPSIIDDSIIGAINIWIEERNKELWFSTGTKIDESNIGIYYTKYYDKEKDYTCGLAYIMKA